MHSLSLTHTLSMRRLVGVVILAFAKGKVMLLRRSYSGIIHGTALSRLFSMVVAEEEEVVLRVASGEGSSFLSAYVQGNTRSLL